MTGAFPGESDDGLVFLRGERHYCEDPESLEGAQAPQGPRTCLLGWPLTCPVTLGKH